MLTQEDDVEIHALAARGWAKAAIARLTGRVRAVFCEQMTFRHFPEAIHTILVELGGTPRVWRTDRMATIVIPGADRLSARRFTPSAARPPRCPPPAS